MESSKKTCGHGGTLPNSWSRTQARPQKWQNHQETTCYNTEGVTGLPKEDQRLQASKKVRVYKSVKYQNRMTSLEGMNERN